MKERRSTTQKNCFSLKNLIDSIYIRDSLRAGAHRVVARPYGKTTLVACSREQLLSGEARKYFMNPIAEIVQDLRVLPCLSVLREEELSSVGKLAKLKKVQKNATLFEESEPVTFFYIVKEGTVKLFKTSDEGRELIVRIMNSGDYFCCAPLYTGGKYFVGAIAVEDSLLVAIPAKDFKKALRNEVTETGWKIISGLCNKIRYLSTLVEDLTFKDVEERVITTLLRLAEERAPDAKVASLQLTHQDIASMTGTVREVVSRAMARLKKEGVIVDSNVKGFKLDKERLLKLIHKRMSAA